MTVPSNDIGDTALLDPMSDDPMMGETDADPDEDPTELVQAVEAILDAVQDSLEGVDPAVLPPELQQAVALLTAADVTMDRLLEVLQIPDPDDSDTQPEVIGDSSDLGGPSDVVGPLPYSLVRQLAAFRLSHRAYSIEGGDLPIAPGLAPKTIEPQAVNANPEKLAGQVQAQLDQLAAALGGATTPLDTARGISAQVTDSLSNGDKDGAADYADGLQQAVGAIDLSTLDPEQVTTLKAASDLIDQLVETLQPEDVPDPAETDDAVLPGVPTPAGVPIKTLSSDDARMALFDGGLDHLSVEMFADVTPGDRGKPGNKGNKGNADSLKRWFNEGADGAIHWGVPGDFMECVAVASKHMRPDQAKGFCNNRHQDTNGGEAAGRDAHGGGAMHAVAASGRPGAMGDGSFPIVDHTDVTKAVRAIGRADESRRPAVKAHIKKRAAEVGGMHLIPDSWKGSARGVQEFVNRALPPAAPTSGAPTTSVGAQHLKEVQIAQQAQRVARTQAVAANAALARAAAADRVRLQKAAQVAQAAHQRATQATVAARNKATAAVRAANAKTTATNKAAAATAATNKKAATAKAAAKKAAVPAKLGGPGTLAPGTPEQAAAGWNEALHPRGAAGSPSGGKFVAQDSGGSGNPQDVEAANGVQSLLGLDKTGKIGTGDVAAIRAYQSKHGLQADGVVGAQTVAQFRGTSAAPGGMSEADHQFLRGKGTAKLAAPMATFDDQSATVAVGAEAAVEPQIDVEGRRFNLPVGVIEGVLTGDKRKIAPQALEWSDPGTTTIPLMAVTKTTKEHQEAELVGRITSLQRDDASELVNPKTGEPYGPGVFVISGKGLFTSLENAQTVAGLVRDKFLRGVSADLSDVSSEFEADPSSGETLADGGEQDLIKLLTGKGSGTELVTAARVRGVTICPFPAFEGAYLEMEGGESTPAIEAETVSASGRWPSFQVQEPEFGARICLPCESGSLVASAAAGPMYPPKSWFQDPGLAQVTPLTITNDGRVFGHLAPWNQCHTGVSGQCVIAPKSRMDYGLFHKGALKTAEGDVIAVGSVTMDTGHASEQFGLSLAASHYDDSGTQAAQVCMGEDRHGVWFSGALMPGLDELAVRRLRASGLSGDWRLYGGNLELMAALAVNVEGFPKPRARVASGAIQALTAAGGREVLRFAQEDGETSDSQPDPPSFTDQWVDKLVTERVNALRASVVEPHLSALRASVVDPAMRLRAAELRGMVVRAPASEVLFDLRVRSLRASMDLDKGMMAAGGYTEKMHPRGKNGKWIHLGDMVDLGGGKTGKVREITPQGNLKVSSGGRTTLIDPKTVDGTRDIPRGGMQELGTGASIGTKDILPGTSPASKPAGELQVGDVFTHPRSGQKETVTSVTKGSYGGGKNLRVASSAGGQADHVSALSSRDLVDVHPPMTASERLSPQAQVDAANASRNSGGTQREQSRAVLGKPSPRL